MSSDSRASDSSAPPSASRPFGFDRIGFPHLLATTLAFVAATILLGVAAKATGSGLACDANWPLCDGGLLNLFPATFPSFFEWIHRVVAMLAGFLIVGTAVAASRDGAVGRGVAVAVTLGMVLTPIQVLLGRETVLSYELPILSLHFWTAILIFLLFALSAVLVWADRLTDAHVALALGLGAATVPVHVALSPLFIGTYTEVVQTLQYAATLALLLAVVLAAVVGRRRFGDRLVTGALSVTAVLTALTVALGRQAVMTFAPALDRLYLAVAGALFVTMLAVAALTRRRPLRAARAPDSG